jgi:hypothetical protein
LDNNGNGVVAPLDALIVINYINSQPGDPSLPPVTPPEVDPGDPPPSFSAGPPYPDVTGDDVCTATDVLAVIDHINAHSGGHAGAADVGLGSGERTSAVVIPVWYGVGPSVPADGGEGGGLRVDRLMRATDEKRLTVPAIAPRGFRHLPGAAHPWPRTVGDEPTDDESPEPLKLRLAEIGRFPEVRGSGRPSASRGNLPIFATSARNAQLQRPEPNPWDAELSDVLSAIAEDVAKSWIESLSAIAS